MSYYSHDELNELGFLELGKNVKVSKKASIYGVSRIAIGDNTRVDDFAVLSAGKNGIEIGRNVHMAVFSMLIGEGRITLGDFSGLSSRASIYSSSDDYSGDFLTNPTVPKRFTSVFSKDVVLEKHVIVGASSVILPGVVIGEGCAVGANSLVNKSAESFTIVAGSPAKEIGTRKNKLLVLESEYLASEIKG